MRNRGIEIFLLPEATQQPAGPGSAQAAPTAAAALQADKELEVALSCEGMPGTGLPHAMAAAHSEVVAHTMQRHRCVGHAC